MSSIISPSYFYGDISIAQLSETSVAANVQRSIDKYEPRIFECLLGATMYGELLAAYDAIDPEGGELASPWKELMGGTTYTSIYGYTKSWIGLAPVLGTVAFSPIANYIYYWYQRTVFTHTVGSGEKKNKSENAVDASPNHKMTRAWNEMVDMNRQLLDYLRSSSIDFPNWSDPMKRPCYPDCKQLFHVIDPLNIC